MIVAAVVLLGCWVYCLLAIAAAMKHARRAHSASRAGELAAVSVLKPLSGLDEGLDENLRSYFEQDYDRYELLFAVRQQWDAAVPVVQRLMEEHPHVQARLLFTGEPPYPHAKVYSLQRMLEEAKYELIAMADSDVRAGRDFCRKLAEEFRDPALGLVTCPYRAVAGSSVWSRMEAVGMNTDFHAGLFTAVMMEGATKFAVGPTIVARRGVLQSLGGMERFKDYIAEDFMLGRVAAESGFAVRLSPYVVEHRIGSETAASNFEHRLRWARLGRRSRPWAYIGQFFTHPLPISAVVCVVFPKLLPFLVVTVVLRSALAYQVSHKILGARVPWLLLLGQDVLGLVFWFAGFFGNSIQWRGRRYLLNRDGTVQPAA